MALDPAEAERVILQTSNESLYLALAGKDAPPASAEGICSPESDEAV